MDVVLNHLYELLLVDEAPTVIAFCLVYLRAIVNAVCLGYTEKRATDCGLSHPLPDAQRVIA